MKRVTGDSSVEQSSMFTEAVLPAAVEKPPVVSKPGRCVSMTLVEIFCPAWCEELFDEEFSQDFGVGQEGTSVCEIGSEEARRLRCFALVRGGEIVPMVPLECKLSHGVPVNQVIPDDIRQAFADVNWYEAGGSGFSVVYGCELSRALRPEEEAALVDAWFGGVIWFYKVLTK